MNWKINSLLIILVSFFGCQMNAQDNRPAGSLATHKPPQLLHLDSNYLTRFPMVNFDKNYFQFYSDESSNWEMLSAKYEAMWHKKQGKLNFYHIGGSHLQADIYTHEVRCKFQTMEPLMTGERGWVFPFDMARTNNPWSYEFFSNNHWSRHRNVLPQDSLEDFGLMGIKIKTTDSLSNLRFQYDKTSVKPAIQCIRVYHNKGYFPFDLFWKDKNYLVKSSQTDTIIGYTEVKFLRPIESFDVEFVRKAPGNYSLEIFGLELLNDVPGISYTNIGINGSALYDYLDCNRWEEQLRISPPDFFAFSLGTNDANVPPEFFDPQVYKSNLEQLIKMVLRVNPQCALLLTVPNDASYLNKYLNPNIEQERKVIQELAQKYQAPVWDFYGIMGELGSSKTWQRAKLMRSDLIHFTKEGYYLKGDLYFDAFQKAMLQMKQCKTKDVKIK